MARPIQVDITGNSSSLERAFARSERAGGRFAGTMGRVSSKTAGRLSTLGGAAVNMSGQFADSEDDATNLAMKLGSVDPTGIGASALVAGTQIGNLIGKVTGLNKVMGRAGEKAYDFAANLGLIHDPMKQFEGKTAPTQGVARFLRNQAFLLEQRGMTPMQAAERLAQTHPNVAKRDIEVYAGAHGGVPTRFVYINNLHTTARNARALEDDLTKKARGRPTRRRGA